MPKGEEEGSGGFDLASLATSAALGDAASSALAGFDLAKLGVEE